MAGTAMLRFFGAGHGRDGHATVLGAVHGRDGHATVLGAGHGRDGHGTVFDGQKPSHGRDGHATVFDSVIVITDRRILDQQIQATIKQFAQVGATVGQAERSGDLRKFIESGKKIIISTVQKFPFILDEIGDQHRGRSFAIIIDEAHSSQGGKTSAALSQALADPEDEINDALEKRMAARKMLENASYLRSRRRPRTKRWNCSASSSRLTPKGRSSTSPSTATR